MSENRTEVELQAESETTENRAAPADPEVAALQTEVDELRRQVAEADATRDAQRHTGRRFAVGLLIVLGCIVLALANMAFWVRFTALNTSGWVAAVGPLSKNPVIVDAVSTIAVEELSAEIDLEAVALELLPEQFQAFSGPLSSVIQGLVADAVAAVLQSDEFHEAWLAANRTVHRTLVDALRGKGSLVYVEEGQVTLDLSDIVGFVEGPLGLEGLDLFGEDWAKFVLFSSDTLATLQMGVALLDAIGLILPLLAIAAFAIAWLVSLWRRRTLLWIGVGVAITMVLSLALLGLLRPVLLAAVTVPQVRAVFAEIWDTVTRGYLLQTIFLLIVGVLIAVGAWLAGPKPRAVAIRTSVGGWWAGLRAKS
jgi:hypothetical protein